MVKEAQLFRDLLARPYVIASYIDAPDRFTRINNSLVRIDDCWDDQAVSISFRY